MQIELEAAESLRRALETDGTAQEIKYDCLVLEDEISALVKLPAEEMKNHPGLWLLEDDDETEEDVEAYVLTEEEKKRFLDELCDLLLQAAEEHSARVCSEMELQQIADEENEMRHHYEV